MIVVNKLNGTIVIAHDLARALSGKLAGKVYRLQIHAMPAYEWMVEADTPDLALNAVMASLAIECRYPATGHTVQIVRGC